MALRNALLHGFLKLMHICCVCHNTTSKLQLIAVFVLVCCRCAGGPIILFLMGTCILMHSDSTSCCYQLMTNLSLNNVDFAKKRWMKPAWVIFQWKFSGFCGDPVDLVQSMGNFFLVCLLSDNRQAIDQCLIWNQITLQGEQWVWCLPIHLNPSEQNKVLQVTRTVPTHFQGAKYCGQSYHDLAIYNAARQF